MSKWIRFIFLFIFLVMLYYHNMNTLIPVIVFIFCCFEPLSREIDKLEKKVELLKIVQVEMIKSQAIENYLKEE